MECYEAKSSHHRNRNNQKAHKKGKRFRQRTGLKLPLAKIRFQKEYEDNDDFKIYERNRL